MPTHSLFLNRCLVQRLHGGTTVLDAILALGRVRLKTDKNYSLNN